MDQVNLWTETPQWLSLLWNILLIVLPTLAATAALTAGGAGVVKTVRWAWAQARPLIDEPTDPLANLIAARTGRTPEQVVDFVVSHIDRIVALLPTEAQPAGELLVPIREVAIPAPVTVSTVMTVGTIEDAPAPENNIG